ncbi:MAG: hypothetical protein WBQ61_24575 [Candidatus Acidiferrum sp.]
MLESKAKSRLPGAAVVMEGRNRRRSERVVLRVPVLLSALMPDGKKVSIQAQTLVVNAHGGLLDVGMEMTHGQQISLCNLKTESVASGRVLRVGGAEEGRFSIAFEFDSPAPQFWPISFLPADWCSIEPGV